MQYLILWDWLPRHEVLSRKASSMQLYLGAAGLRCAPCLSTSGVAAHELQSQSPKNGKHSGAI